MKKFNGYEEAKKNAEYTGSEKLPSGAYICKIMAAREETFDWGNRIVVQFDITEGEQKDFFKKQYDGNTADDKKWKGVARINEPKDDGTEQDGWTKNAFARWTNSIEKSNSGYTWDWDEQKWKGKKIGLIFREVGKEINGKSVRYTEVSRPCSVEEVQKDSWYKKAAEFYAYKGYNASGSASSSEMKTDDYGFVSVPDTDEEAIPF